MKSKEGWFFIIPIIAFILGFFGLLYNEFFGSRIASDPAIITGTLELPLDEPIFLVSYYHALELVAPNPYVISPEVWLSCMAPNPQEEALLQSEHAGFSVRLYANEEAIPFLQEGEGRKFPKGTIIVKEKLLAPDDTDLFALGMMIKRESGFDPDANDWEFGYWLQDGTLIEGNENLSNCVQCHREQAATDMVFWTSQP